MKKIRMLRTCGMAALAIAMLLGSVSVSAAAEAGAATLHSARVQLKITYPDKSCSKGRESCIKHEKLRNGDLMEYMCRSEDLPRGLEIVAGVSCSEEMDVTLMVWDKELEEPADCMPIELEMIGMVYAEDRKGRPKKLTTNSITENEDMLMSVSGRVQLSDLPNRLSDSEMFLEMEEPEACVRGFQSTAVAGVLGQGEAVIMKGNIRLGKPRDVFPAYLLEDDQ